MRREITDSRIYPQGLETNPVENQEIMKSHSEPRRQRLSAILLLCLTLPALGEDQSGTKDDSPSSFSEALAAGKTTFTLRYRFETVDQDGFDKDAEASTLRTTLSYGSAPYKGFRFFVEAENVAAVPDDDDYNNAGAGSLNNRVRDRPVVADPELTQINQAYLEYGFDKTTLKLGRQAVNLGNQRFVGAVGWRQHHQSFDALSVVNHSFDRTQFSYVFLNKVHRIFGDRRDLSSHLGNAVVKLGEKDSLTAYAYWLDYEEPVLARLSTATYGLRWAGRRQLPRTEVTYALEAAQQQDNADNPGEIDADYFLAELAAGNKTFTVKLGYEVLSGSPADGAFSTPLATLHKFNGWADKFLVTPATGLEDLYLGFTGGTKKFRWKVFYHDFQPESSGDDYGTELDVETVYKTNKGLAFGLKGAFYDADAFATDTDKIMFWSAYKFGS